MRTTLVGMADDEIIGCLAFDSVNQSVDWLNEGLFGTDTERRIAKDSKVFAVVATSGMAFQIEKLGKTYGLVTAHGAIPPTYKVKTAAPKQYKIEMA